MPPSVQRLLIDVQALQVSSGGRGIGRYLVNLVRGLRRARPDLRLELVVNTHLAPVDRARVVEGVEWLQYAPPFPSVGIPPGAGWRRASSLHFADWLTARRADAVLLGSCFEFETVLPDFVGPRPLVGAIVYDVIPLLFPELYLSDPRAQAWFGERLRTVLDLDCLLAISGHTAADLQSVLDLGPGRVSPIGGALDEDFLALAEGGEPVASPGREFLLVLAQDDPRKDVTAAVRAWSSLPPAQRDRLDLVIAGELGEATRSDIARLAAAADSASGIRLVGRVTDAELRRLYGACRAFVFPSLYEGLGLPLLEALACGAPVVARAASSIPEFAGPQAFLAPGSSPGDLLDALLRALREPADERRAARMAFARSFRWEDTARAALRALEGARPAARRDEPAEWRRRVLEAVRAPEPFAVAKLLEHWSALRRAGHHPAAASPVAAQVARPGLVAGDLADRRGRARDLARRLLAPPDPREPPSGGGWSLAELEDEAELDVSEAAVLPSGAGPLRRALHRVLILTARPWLARQTRFNHAILGHLRRER